MLEELGEYEAAEEMYWVALEEKPDYVEALSCLSNLLHDLNYHDLAGKLDQITSNISRGEALTAPMLELDQNGTISPSYVHLWT